MKASIFSWKAMSLRKTFLTLLAMGFFAIFCSNCIVRVKEPVSKRYLVSDNKLTLLASPFMVTEVSKVLFATSKKKNKYVRLLVCKKSAQYPEKMLADKKYCRPALLMNKYSATNRHSDDLWMSTKYFFGFREKIGVQEVVFRSYVCPMYPYYRSDDPFCSKALSGFYPVPISQINFSESTAQKMGLLDDELLDDKETKEGGFGQDNFNKYIEHYFSVTRRYIDSFYKDKKEEVLKDFLNLPHARREAVDFLELVANLRAIEMEIELITKMQSVSKEKLKKDLQVMGNSLHKGASLRSEFLKKKRAHESIPAKTFFFYGQAFNKKRKEAEMTEVAYIQALIDIVPMEVISVAVAVYKDGEVDQKLALLSNKFKELRAQMVEKEKKRKYFYQWKKEDIEAVANNQDRPGMKKEDKAGIQIFTSIANAFKEAVAAGKAIKPVFHSNKFADGTPVESVEAVVKGLSRATQTFYNEDALALANE